MSIAASAWRPFGVMTADALLRTNSTSPRGPQRLAKDQVIATEFSRPSSRSQLLKERTLVVS
jgi:hypothetical protein